jgi:hypothetical protein
VFTTPEAEVVVVVMARFVEILALSYRNLSVLVVERRPKISTPNGMMIS